MDKTLVGNPMTIADRWLLPDGVEELLPEEAARVEQLRRKVLDLYASWGYELVIPPLIEFTESLLLGLESDIDIQTFKVLDQLSGRMMGVRADITPQTARIDAHSLNREGPVRLCYAGSVLHTKPKSLLASRSPIQIGAELYGDGGLSSDIEIICLMLETLKCAGIENITLDLGHVGIYRALIEQAGLEGAKEQQLFDALQRKSAGDIKQAICNSFDDEKMSQMMLSLSQLNGDRSVLEQARQILAEAPDEVAKAVNDLSRVADVVKQRMPDIDLYFDLSELRGFHYHTGLVFAALAPGHGQAVANGGRYDHIGEVFGRARPATGFNADLKALLSYLPNSDKTDYADAIFAPDSEGLPEQQASLLWQTEQGLRARGEKVINGLSGQVSSNDFRRQLVFVDNVWRIEDK